MYKVSAKRNGKWWTFGTIKKNKFDNLQLSLKVTPELKELVNSSEWINFSLFKEKEGDEPKPKLEPKKEVATNIDDDCIPFSFMIGACLALVSLSQGFV